GSAPSTPYWTHNDGPGPACANTLFADTAEFGLGMHIGTEKLRDKVEDKMREAIATCNCCSDDLKALMQEWIDGRHNASASADVSARLIPMLQACDCATCRQLLEMKDNFVKKSQWIIGGDGWAY
ncbi:MAG: pyruvate:ferredoxin (flavodoxin) oxidoreductase, partial [Alistipes sp.]|nr:pyruvate:ferredoxin (flavodoxin) oxidoreductase [Alistipes sp.]